MKTAIIVHGMPSREEFEKKPEQTKLHWIPWLVQALKARHVAAMAPEMPTPYAPVYEQWKDAFERIPRTDETVLIGHSCGGGFLVRWLSEHDGKVGQVLLVAPWIDPEKELTSGFFDFGIDTDLVDKTINGIVMFYSTDDDIDILDSVQKIKSIKGIKIREFTDKGHFVTGDGVSEFPELLDEIK